MLGDETIFKLEENIQQQQQKPQQATEVDNTKKKRDSEEKSIEEFLESCSAVLMPANHQQYSSSPSELQLLQFSNISTTNNQNNNIGINIIRASSATGCSPTPSGSSNDARLPFQVSHRRAISLDNNPFTSFITATSSSTSSGCVPSYFSTSSSATSPFIPMSSSTSSSDFMRMAMQAAISPSVSSPSLSTQTPPSLSSASNTNSSRNSRRCSSSSSSNSSNSDVLPSCAIVLPSNSGLAVSTSSSKTITTVTTSSSSAAPHRRQRVRQHQCLYCPKMFFKPQDVKRHMVVHDNLTRPFKCERCGFSFKRRDTLQRHYKSRCGDSHDEDVATN